MNIDTFSSKTQCNALVYLLLFQAAFSSAAAFPLKNAISHATLHIGRSMICAQTPEGAMAPILCREFFICAQPRGGYGTNLQHIE